MGLLERGGRVRPTVISDTSANTVIVADLELAQVSVQTIDDLDSQLGKKGGLARKSGPGAKRVKLVGNWEELMKEAL